MLLWKRVYIWSWSWNLHAFSELTGCGFGTLSSPGAWWDWCRLPIPRITGHVFPAPLLADALVLLSIIYIEWLFTHQAKVKAPSFSPSQVQRGAMSLLLILENFACCFSSWAIRRQLRKGGSVHIWEQGSILPVLPGILQVPRKSVSSNCCLLSEGCMHFLLYSSPAPAAPLPASLCSQRGEAQNQNPAGLPQIHALPTLPNQWGVPRGIL